MVFRVARLAWAALVTAIVSFSVPHHGLASPVEEKAVTSVSLATDQYGDSLPPGALARVGTIRLRHATTWSLAFSPRAELLASAANGRICVWRLRDGKLLHQFALPSPSCVAFSPGGKTLAAGDWNGETFLWDLQSKTQLNKISGQERRRINALAFSSDEKLLAIGSDHSGRVLDVRSGKEVWQFTPEKTGVNSLAFSPDGKTLATGSGDGMIGLWSSATGKELRRLPKQSGDLKSLAFSLDGKTLVSAGPNRNQETGEVNTWDMESGKRLSHFKVIGHWFTATLSNDGKMVAIESAGADVTVLAADTGKEVSKAATSQSLSTVIAFSPDSKLMATTGPGSGLQTWDPTTMKPVQQIGGHQLGIRTVTFAGHGRYLATANSEGAFLWDAASGKQLAPLDGKLRIDPVLAASADGTLLAVGSEETSLWHLENRRMVRRLPINLLSRPSLSFSEDSRMLLAPGSSGSLVAWDVGSGKVALTFEVKDDDDFLIHAIAPSPGGKAFVAAGFGARDGEVMCAQWQQAAHKETAVIHKLFARQSAYHLALSPDGQFIAYDDGDDVVTVCHVLTGRQCVQFTATKKKDQLRAVWCLAFSPDGKTLAIGNLDQSIRLWEVATGNERRHFLGHEDRIRQLAFAPDGKKLASASDDTTVLVWDLSAATDRLPPPKELPKLWASLAEEDAAKAYQSMWAMAHRPEESIAFLKPRLPPVSPADAKVIARLITELESKDFTVRDKATRQLAELKELAVGALRKTLANNPMLETRRRLEALVENVEAAPLSADQLQKYRAIETLELIGTEKVWTVLQPLADGVADARVTREARAALERLNKMPRSSKKR